MSCERPMVRAAAAQAPETSSPARLTVVAAEHLVVSLVGVEQLSSRGHVPPPHGTIYANGEKDVPRALGVHARRAEAHSHDRHRILGSATQRVLELLRGRVEHLRNGTARAWRLSGGALGTRYGERAVPASKRDGVSHLPHPDGSVVARSSNEVPVLRHIQGKNAGSHGPACSLGRARQAR